MVHVVEYQKRGLFHAHILLILKVDDKPRCADDYDAIVCAEDLHPCLESQSLSLTPRGARPLP